MLGGPHFFLCRCVFFFLFSQCPDAACALSIQYSYNWLISVFWVIPHCSLQGSGWNVVPGCMSVHRRHFYHCFLTCLLTGCWIRGSQRFLLWWPASKPSPVSWTSSTGLYSEFWSQIIMEWTLTQNPGRNSKSVKIKVSEVSSWRDSQRYVVLDYSPVVKNWPFAKPVPPIIA